MDPRTSAQELILCELCKTGALQSHCELCQINLCKACVGEHLSDSSKRHNVVPYKHRKSTPNYPKCAKHAQKHCELYCEKCDIPVCITCISSEHKGHDLSDIQRLFSSKTVESERDLRELRKEIYPVYEKIASDLNSEKVNLQEHFEKLTIEITKQGEDWHREINIIVNKRKSEIDEMKAKYLALLNKQQEKIKRAISDVNQSILDLNEILDSNEVSLTCAYKSRNAEFRNLPPKVNVQLPSFSSQINKEQLHEMFGSLCALSITTAQRGYIMETSEAVSCPPVKPLLDEPELITTIDTKYKNLFSVACLTDDEIWTCGDIDIINFYNNKGILLKSVQTKTRSWPGDIAVTRSGDLVYTDNVSRTVNLVKKNQIQELFRLRGWKPYYVCSTSSGDLLVTMISNDKKESKVVHYSDSSEKQTIQFDDEDKPLFSSHHVKYISENRNQDICVADLGANAVVVVDQAGKLRFRYTGHRSTTSEPFEPHGITTDSQSQILIADTNNHCIHILDQHGQFLRYINNCDISFPSGLCTDKRDHVFVAQWIGGKVKKIK
ncbi:uncharacterized protein LOC134277627, partial [Saccostrea cucullata]|uniref:uncharacterized protein LOC134277627 n=1 Tax=Saccostrea cuccullata TaxID=36930 RepID=UPI002ED1EA92